MFGCSDVYHWMGRTAKAICLPDCGRNRPALVSRAFPGVWAASAAAGGRDVSLGDHGHAVDGCARFGTLAAMGGDADRLPAIGAPNDLVRATS